MVSQNFYAAGAHGSELLIPTQIIQIVLRCISVHLNVPFESLAPQYKWVFVVDTFMSIRGGPPYTRYWGSY